MSRQQQERQSNSVRGLLKSSSTTAMSPESNSKTLFFTSATSTNMPLTDGNRVPYTGLYKCTLNENEEEGGQVHCEDTRKVADGLNRDGKPHAALSVHNLQFHNGDGNGDNNNNDRTSSSSYLYANIYVDNVKDHPDVHVGSWEIVRAKLPGNENGILQFESFFRTLGAFDWNECNFKCCPYQGDTDDDPFAFSKDEDNPFSAHTHAYVRTIPRSFAVDEQTGDVFISWEGFYQNCDPAGMFSARQKGLEWTIGVSRLKTEDPYCVVDQVHALDNNFSRCTEPVSIVYQSSRGREVVLPNGGFAVIPASGDGGNGRRSFLLSALKSPGIGQGELTSHVWAFPEGGNVSQDGRLLQDLSLSGKGTVVDNIFMDENVWDGGTLRLHYNQRTGRPDHLCRTIFNEGIGCMPISVTEDNDSVYIMPQGEEEILLSEEQVYSFCRLRDADRTKRRMTTLVTGLEVVWNEDGENGTGIPERIIFGCYGGEGGNGNFGSNLEGANPVQVMKGAYPGAVLFVPDQLESSTSTTDHSADVGVGNSSSTIFRNYKIFSTQSCSMMMVFLLVCIVSCTFNIKRRLSRRHHSTKSISSPNTNISFEKESSGLFRSDTPYVELPTIDSSHSLSRYSSSSSLSTEDDILP